MFKIIDSDLLHVDYFGIRILVTENTKGIATDDNGDVCMYENSLPTKGGVGWKSPTSAYTYVATITFEGDWKDSLMEV